MIETVPIGNFLGGPVFKNSPCNAGDAGSIPDRETKIPRAAGQPESLHATRKNPRTQLRPDAAKN